MTNKRSTPRAFAALLIWVMWLCVAHVPAVFAQDNPGLAIRPASQTTDDPTKPRLVVQTGHSSYVQSISFSPDGRTLASGSADNTIKLWDVATGKEIRTLAGHSHYVDSVSFSPDGRTLASGSGDSTIKLWDVATGKEIRTLTGHSDDVFSVSFSPDGRTLASGSGDNTIKLWDVTTGEEIRTLTGHSDRVYSVSFSPDSRTLASGSTLWDVATGKEIRTLTNAERVWCVIFSPDGRTLASGSQDNAIHLWNVENGEEIRAITGHSEDVGSVSFSPDGRTLASGGRIIQLWDFATGKRIRTLTGHSSGVTSVIFSPDGRTLASGSNDKNIKLWDVATGKEVRTLTGHSNWAWSVSYSPDGRTLASGSNDNTVKLWDVATGKEIRTLAGHSDTVLSVSFSPDGRTLASGCSDNTIKLWDAATGEEIRTLIGHSGMVNSVSFSPDGRTLASGSRDKTITLWDVATGKEIRTLTGHSNWVISVSFSPSGRILASGCSDNTIKLWDVETGKEVRNLAGHSYWVFCISFSPDGRTLASGGLDKINLWDVANGTEVRTLIGHSGMVNSVRFSPDGRTLASGSNVNTVKLWDVATGKEIRTLAGHSEPVMSVGFSPDGKTVASSSHDKTVRLWEVESGRLLVSLVCTIGGGSLAATPDNYYFADKSALPAVAFAVGNRAYSFEQFDLKFNRPDKVMEALGNPNKELVAAYCRAYQKRLKLMNFTEDMLGGDFHVPEVGISSKEIPLSTTERRLRFNVKASDSKYNLDRLNVYVNDVPVFGSNGINLRDKKTKQVEMPIDIELCSGANKVQVSTLNQKGAESLMDTFSVTCTADSGKPDLYVAVVGVSKYAEPKANLEYAAKDAADLATAIEQHKDSYGNVHVIRLLDDNATRANILALRDTFAKTKVDDSVVLFLAGHGVLDSNLDFLFCPYDMDVANFLKSRTTKVGVPYESIEALLDGIPARKKLLMMDSCHSGEVDPEAAKIQLALKPAAENVQCMEARGFGESPTVGLDSSFDLMQDLFTNLRRGSGAQVISAAGGMQVAYEGKGKENGLFTYCVLDALAQGKTRISQLRDYVFDQVEKLSGGRQKPTARRENIEFDFALF